MAIIDYVIIAVYMVGIVRMTADGGIDEGVFLRQCDAALAGGEVAADVHDRPLLGQRGEDLVAVGIEARVVQMRMRIKIH